MESNFRILVVTENVDNCKLLKQLDAVGFEVLSCDKDLVAIIDKCNKNHPQFLLADEEFYLTILKMGMNILLENFGVKIIVLPDTENFELKELVTLILLKSEILLPKSTNIHLSEKSYIDEMIRKSMNELCFLSIYLGSEYIRLIMKAICNSQLNYTDSMSKTVYPFVAKKNFVTPESVERSIRTAIEKCWEKSSISVRKKYFGESFCCMKERPSNREFIAVLGEYFLREVKKFRREI